MLLLAAGLALPVVNASAADTAVSYVDSEAVSCSDSAPGTGTSAQPYCTLQAAANAAQPGGTVEVMSGTYPATTITASGAPGAPISIEGKPANVTLPSLDLNGVHDVKISGLHLTLTSAGVRLQDCSNVTLDSDLVGPSGTSQSSAWGVDISGQSDGVVVSRSDLQFYPSVRVGPGVRDAILTTNSMRGVALDGSVNAAVTSNDINWGNIPVGLKVSGGATGTSVENNAFAWGGVQVDADSTVGATFDYNLLDLTPEDSPYTWAGTAYPDLPAFRTATGQGSHDILRRSAFAYAFNNNKEHSPSVDSADAGARGELPTDKDGKPRVDDSLVPNSGTGGGFHDRGAQEFQDPYRPEQPSIASNWLPYNSPVTLTWGDINPWGEAISRTIDFGDNTPELTTTDAVVKHTYGPPPGGGTVTDRITIRETAPGNTYVSTYGQYVVLQPPAPLVPVLHATEQNQSDPMTVTVNAQGSSSPWDLGTVTYNFGDGTAAVTGQTYADVIHTYRKPGAYSLSASVHDAGGRVATKTQKIGVGPVFMPATPARILDTRAGNGAAKAPVASGHIVHLMVNGRGGVAHASSVLLNLTVTGGTAPGYVTAFPHGSARPNASSLNYRTGQTVANLVDVPIGPDGIVELYNQGGKVQLIADVEGFDTLTPRGAGTVLKSAAYGLGDWPKVLDTRGSTSRKLGARESVTFTAFPAPPPQDGSMHASAVVLKVTETSATAASYVQAYTPGRARPVSSNLNFAAGETRSTTVVVPMDYQGRVSLYNSAGSVDLIVSAEGVYYPFVPRTDSVNRPMAAITPVRALDTRTTIGGHHSRLGVTQKLRFKVAGISGVPAGATGVLVNLTAVNGSGSGYLSSWGEGTRQPGDSSVNYMVGQVTPNLVYLSVLNGYVDLYNGSDGTVDVLADVEAYSVN